MEKMIYSDNNERMIHAGFTVVNPGHAHDGDHYTWNELDEMYWNDAEDGVGFMLDLIELASELAGNIKWD